MAQMSTSTLALEDPHGKKDDGHRQARHVKGEAA